MTKLLQNPIVLLLMTGALLGFNLPLGKIASDANVSPLIWALIVSLGACSILLPILIAQKRLVLPKSNMIRYIIISAFISFIAPNILLFSVMAHVGAGYMGLMFALSPVFTLGLAIIFQMKTPNFIGIIGISFGLIGAIIISVTRGSAPDAPPLIWMAASLLVPIMLACGNIYRTLDWPKDATPDSLAFWGHAFSILVFIILIFVQNGNFPVNELTQSPLAALAQLLVAGILFPIFFRLQKKGGPVLLSQIGYVAAAVGLILATFILGELYSQMTWIGAAIIGVGIIITITSQKSNG